MSRLQMIFMKSSLTSLNSKYIFLFFCLFKHLKMIQLHIILPKLLTATPVFYNFTKCVKMLIFHCFKLTSFH